jgi:Hint domain
VAEYVWSTVTGDGQAATPYVWNGAQFNWNTPGFWYNANVLQIAATAASGTVPASGTGTSGGPGQDDVTLVAGDLNPEAMGAYSYFGGPSLGSVSYPVDLLINAGTIDLRNLALAGFQNDLYAIPEHPTIEVHNATLKIEGSITTTGTAVFPDAGLPSPVFGTLLANGGGGTIAIATGTVEIAGSVLPSVANGATKFAVVAQFANAVHNVLQLDAVSSSQSGAFDGSIAGFGAGDTIDLPGVPYSAALQPDYFFYGGFLAVGELGISDGVTNFASLQLYGSTYTNGTFLLLPDNKGGTEIVSCFAAGTRIRTPSGYRAVETLCVGEMVAVLSEDAVAPIQRIERRRLDCRCVAHPSLVWPVRIAAGTFGPGKPQRDLYLSPDHALFIDGVLVPVKYLIDGGAVAQVKRDVVEYFHLQLPRHDVVLAEGLPVESYLEMSSDAADFAAHEREAAAYAPFAVYTSPAQRGIGPRSGPMARAGRGRGPQLNPRCRPLRLCDRGSAPSPARRAG